MPPRQSDLLALTAGHGPTAVTIRFLDASDDAVLHGQDTPPVPFASPLEVREVAIEVPKLDFPAPGVYAWQVAYGTEVLYERRLLARASG